MNVSQIRNCLQNKELLLLGDSTTRQWAETIPKLLQIPDYKPRNKKTEYHHFIREYKQLNLTVSFNFHPLIGTKTKIPVNEVHYEVDILQSMPTNNCSHLVLVISPWAHYCQWSKESYKQRLLKIREGILKFKVRCPDVPIIIKGSHPREQASKESRIYYSNYILHEINALMKDTFYRSGAWFLDVWDLNLSYPATNNVHMPDKCVEQELMSFITYLCEK